MPFNIAGVHFHTFDPQPRDASPKGTTVTRADVWLSTIPPHTNGVDSALALHNVTIVQTREGALQVLMPEHREHGGFLNPVVWAVGSFQDQFQASLAEVYQDAVDREIPKRYATTDWSPQHGFTNHFAVLKDGNDAPRVSRIDVQPGDPYVSKGGSFVQANLRVCVEDQIEIAPVRALHFADGSRKIIMPRYRDRDRHRDFAYPVTASYRQKFHELCLLLVDMVRGDDDIVSTNVSVDLPSEG